jgi:hypothetical protein
VYAAELIGLGVLEQKYLSILQGYLRQSILEMS